MKCTLAKEINTCPFYDKDKMECKNETDCSFQEGKTEIPQQKEKYVRKERWYEKYYRKNDFRK